ncbi:unnamed protein product [Protopolystoma xenopodis]|uniref:Uncharacterized protein n=1 Tax=Protopolystoma xenopodis TaxID=117903 RepID=A0A3S5AP91_9PLAT|nr:unnamed protein product [Protopolystoma xenopodis]
MFQSTRKEALCISCLLHAASRIRILYKSRETGSLQGAHFRPLLPAGRIIPFIDHILCTLMTAQQHKAPIIDRRKCLRLSCLGMALFPNFMARTKLPIRWANGPIKLHRIVSISSADTTTRLHESIHACSSRNGDER